MKATEMPERHKIEIEEIHEHKVWWWYCPHCGAENELEVDPKGGGIITCRACDHETEIIESK